MINLHVLHNDIKVNVLANLSIRDMSQVFRVNKMLLTSQKDLLPSLQNVIEMRVNTMVVTLLAQLEKNKCFREIISLKNIHPSQWESELDIYFLDDLKYKLQQPPSSLQDISIFANKWIFNKIIIKIPPSSWDMNWHFFRLSQEIIEKKSLEILEVDENDDPMHVDDGDTSSSSSSPCGNSTSEVIEFRAPKKRLTEQDYIRMMGKWITVERQEDKNKLFYSILKEFHHSNLNFAVLIDCLKKAANEIYPPEQMDKHIGTLFQSLLAFGQFDAVNAHLYSQNKNAISEFFAQSVSKFIEQLKLLLIKYPTDNYSVNMLKRCGFLYLMKSYIKNKNDTRALALAKYDMHNPLCHFIIDLFDQAARSKMERLQFCCQLLVKYPQVLKNQHNNNVIKTCVAEAIEEYGLRFVEEVIPDKLRDLFDKFSHAELAQLQSKYETNKQIHFLALFQENEAS